MIKKQKLELTWIGKDEQPVLEPRILIEDPTKSYGDALVLDLMVHKWLKWLVATPFGV
jgi:adenine-specific DNA-methyltransferase